MEKTYTHYNLQNFIEKICQIASGEPKLAKECFFSMGKLTSVMTIAFTSFMIILVFIKISLSFKFFLIMLVIFVIFFSSINIVRRGFGFIGVHLSNCIIWKTLNCRFVVPALSCSIFVKFFYRHHRYIFVTHTKNFFLDGIPGNYDWFQRPYFWPLYSHCCTSTTRLFPHLSHVSQNFFFSFERINFVEGRKDKFSN